MLTAKVAASSLKVGANSASFQVDTRNMAGAGVFYDALKLENRLTTAGRFTRSQHLPRAGPVP